MKLFDLFLHSKYLSWMGQAIHAGVYTACGNAKSLQWPLQRSGAERCQRIRERVSEQAMRLSCRPISCPTGRIPLWGFPLWCCVWNKIVEGGGVREMGMGRVIGCAATYVKGLACQGLTFAEYVTTKLGLLAHRRNLTTCWDTSSSSSSSYSNMSQWGESLPIPVSSTWSECASLQQTL